MSGREGTTTPAWVTGIIEAARPVLSEDRSTTLVLWPTGGTPFAHGRYKLAAPKPGQMPSARLRPYFATVARMTGDAFNGYVVVRRGDKIVVYSGADTVLAYGKAGAPAQAAAAPTAVVCPHCERTRGVRLDGRVRVHHNPVTEKRCQGAGRPSEFMERAPRKPQTD